MPNKILCPYHEEDTPSLMVYTDHYHCFGCGAHGPLDKLEKVSKFPFKKSSFSGYKEDIKKELEKISQLPLKSIRGFNLPHDDFGFYIVYPNTSYYVKRLWDSTTSKKYRNPVGHKKSLYIPLKDVFSNRLLLIEGQVNALTAAHCVDAPTIASAGSCNDMSNSAFIDYYLQFEKICIIVDKDAVGVAAAVELKQILTKHRKKVAIYAMPKDLNETYTQDGAEEARIEIKKALDLL